MGGGKEGIPGREISMDKRAEVKCSWPILKKKSERIRWQVL